MRLFTPSTFFNAFSTRITHAAHVMPVTAMSTIERSSQLSGAPFPRHLAEQFERVADDPAAVRALGLEQMCAMCDRLLAEGVPGIHFITLNRSTATREIWQQLSLSAIG